VGATPGWERKLGRECPNGAEGPLPSVTARTSRPPLGCDRDAGSHGELLAEENLAIGAETNRPREITPRPFRLSRVIPRHIA
jgi:hypothetical protein